LTLFALFYVYHAQNNVCEKYSDVLKINNLQLVTKILDGALPGIVSGPTKKYFDGSKPNHSLNYLDPANSAQLAALKTSLVQFFGTAMECSDGSIPAYSGPPMDKVHQKMGISSFEFNHFNDQVFNAVKALGATEEDAVAVKILLNTYKQSIVLQGTICDRYSVHAKMSNKELMFSIVLKVISRVAAPDNVNRKYFDGEKPRGSMNFLDAKNKNAFDGLVNGLACYFGQALGCNDDTLPPYGGDTLQKVHARKKITIYEFHTFNADVLAVLVQVAPVSRQDIRTISFALNSTMSKIVNL